MTYAFVLGREAALSAAEILAVLKAEGIEYDKSSFAISQEVLLLQVPTQLSPELFHRLGGSIKMIEIIKKSENIESDLLELLQEKSGNSLDFGLSIYHCGAPRREYEGLGRWQKPLMMELKKKLREGGMSVRAVLPKTGTTLTSVQVDKNHLITKGIELNLIATSYGTYIGMTLAVQAFESFSKRDFGRPGRDTKSGMLPPKLARMMINLAAAPKDKLLLDPFCGSGTIMTEAVLLGYQQLLGTDVSEKAVEDTKKNYNWTIEKNDIRGVRFKTFKRDVKTLAEKVEKESVTAIVTEPFLGPPLRGHESDQQIHRNFLELMELYRRAFKTFAQILEPGGVVVFVFPFFGNKHVNILRELQEMGFKPEGLLPGKAVEALRAKSSTGLVYRRPDQKVGRDIFRFKFHPPA